MSARTAHRLSKVCCTCRVEKPLEAFGRDRTRPDGRYGRCRLCESAMRKAQYQANPKKSNEHARKWREANHAYSVQKAKDWARRNPERRKVIANRHATKKYRQNIEASRAKGRAAARRRWQLDYDGMIVYSRQLRAKRRALKRGTAVGRVSYKRIAARDGMRCHLCKRPVEKADLAFDHVIPLAKGGTHTEENIAVAHAKCNAHKHAKVLTLF